MKVVLKVVVMAGYLVGGLVAKWVGLMVVERVFLLVVSTAVVRVSERVDYLVVP